MAGGMGGFRTGSVLAVSLLVALVACKQSSEAKPTPSASAVPATGAASIAATPSSAPPVRDTVKCKAAGSKKPVALAEGAFPATEAVIRTDTSHVYFSIYHANSKVTSRLIAVSKGGGEASVLYEAPTQSEYVTLLGLADGQVHFRRSNYRTNEKSVLRVPITGGKAEPSGKTADDFPALPIKSVSDDAAEYSIVVHEDPEGIPSVIPDRLIKKPKKGGASQTLATWPVGIALDEDCVYYLDSQSNQVSTLFAVAK